MWLEITASFIKAPSLLLKGLVFNQYLTFAFTIFVELAESSYKKQTPLFSLSIARMDTELETKIKNTGIKCDEIYSNLIME